MHCTFTHCEQTTKDSASVDELTKHKQKQVSAPAKLSVKSWVMNTPIQRFSLKNQPVSPRAKHSVFKGGLWKYTPRFEFWL